MAQIVITLLNLACNWLRAGWVIFSSAPPTRSFAGSSISRLLKYRVAVMKKFHGSNVPRPRMKNISQTALYLSGGGGAIVMVSALR